MFQTPKPPSIYASMASMQQQAQQQAQQAQQQQAVRDSYLRNTSSSEDRESRDAEQNEALSLVMTPKKKRSKVNIKVFFRFLYYLLLNLDPFACSTLPLTLLFLCS